MIKKRALENVNERFSKIEAKEHNEIFEKKPLITTLLLFEKCIK